MRAAAVALGALALGLTAGVARADLGPPSGNLVTGGVVTGAVFDASDDKEPFIDAELAWTYYPRDFAGGTLAPGLVVDPGYDLGHSLARVNVGAKLGVFYLFGLEGGYAWRTDGDRTIDGPMARARVNVPVGHSLYVSASYRACFFPGETVSELGFALKIPLWGDSAKLEGVLNE